MHKTDIGNKSHFWCMTIPADTIADTPGALMRTTLLHIPDPLSQTISDLHHPRQHPRQHHPRVVIFLYGFFLRSSSNLFFSFVSMMETHSETAARTVTYTQASRTRFSSSPCQYYPTLLSIRNLRIPQPYIRDSLSIPLRKCVSDVCVGQPF